jgi:hypothetical protein
MIQKLWLPIPQHFNLMCIKSPDPFVPLTPQPLLILPLQQHPRHNTPTEQEQHHVGEHDAVTQLVPRLVAAAVDVGGHDAVEVAPADDEAEGYAALVDAFDVVGGPGDGVCYAGVYFLISLGPFFLFP